MERTLSIQVLGAVGSGKTKLLALITTLLRKEGVLIVGSPSETVCAESVQVKFDFDAYDSRTKRTLTGYEAMHVIYDDESVLTINLKNKTVQYDDGIYAVFSSGLEGKCATYTAGYQGVKSITVT